MNKHKDILRVVGVGASAGGLQALKQLFEHIPADVGMAFVVVQHLDPTKKSLLAKALAKFTSLPVKEATNGTKITQNHIYTMPSDSYMKLQDRTLRLDRREKRDVTHKPIDAFFESLAKYCGKNAVGIVLSGTGSDGTAGIQSIKENGGRTFAQDDTALFKDMPYSAIASGNVDFILSPDMMVPLLTRATTEPKSKIKSEDNDIGPVLSLLKAKTGIDFSHYKQTSVNRRIQRRMFLNHIKVVKVYASLLTSNPNELEALSKDMLIHVTSFFRNPEQLDELQKAVFPELLKNASSKKLISVWIPGCASGEEAYSLAIAFQEFIANKKIRPRVHILGTDIAKDAIEQASKGFYKETITQQVSPERLRQFFTKVSGGYKIKESVRAMCEFEVHDVAQKPPHLNFDLVSCRNTLIYLGEELQQKALAVLLSALKPEGILLLGKSEDLRSVAKYFSLLNNKQRIYLKKAPSSTADNLRGAIKTQLDRGATPLVGLKTITPQIDESSHTARQKKITKLKEAVALTQEYTNEIIGELDVMNEKLQSTNEELASNSEELQSSNEEMTTLSEELQTRNEEVTVTRDYADAIIRTVRGPLIVLNKDLRIISANEAFYTTFKVPPSETENRLLYDLGNRQWNIPRLRVLLEEILPEKNTIEDFVVEHDFTDIGQKTMLLNARTLQQGPDKTSLILLAIEDITVRKQLEQQKDEFISIASHELKTPITSVKAYTQILGQRFRKAKDMNSAELVGKMDSQLDKLANLIDDLLDITKIEAGKVRFNRSYFNFNELVEETVDELQRTTEKHHIEQNLQPMGTIYGDHDRLGQVLTNLITNAIKYSPHADKIIVKSAVDKNNITLCVQDFGVGLSPTDQAKVFERFYRVGGPDKNTYPGLGLGLYITSEIIKRHKGRVWVESIKTKGSTFCFSIPIAKKKPKQPFKNTQSKQTSKS